MQKLVDSQPVGRVQILALGEHVDYWDQLGWRDRFSSASLTHRQQVYGARFGGDSIYTPQMVVDGRTAFVGSDAGAARQALEQTAKLPHGRIRITVDDATASSLSCSIAWSELPPGGERADVVVAVTEDGLSSNVTRGENHGRVLAHAAVVRHLAVAGEAAKDGPATVRAQIPVGGDWRRDRLKIVAFVQERRSRAILAAGATSAPGR
jgi:hypothetical protein